VPGFAEPGTPGEVGLAPELVPGLLEAGFNLTGVLSASRYDSLVPPAWRCAELLSGARVVVVLGCGGRAFGAAFRSSPEFALPTDPVDAFSARVVERAAAALESAGSRCRALFPSQRREGAFADFVALARACGLGAPSRLGLLLHPRFGPWLALRALLMTDRPLVPTAGPLDFDPCPSCSAPCARACRGAAVGASRFEVRRCWRTRLAEPDCRLRCEARRACVFGAEHALDPEMEAQHMRASLPFLGVRAEGPEG
jgi:hypothetical protein